MGVQVTVAATQIDKQRLGYQAISLTNFSATTEPSVTAGSKIEVDGALYEFTSDETGTGWSGIGVSNDVYFYLVPSGSSSTWAYSTTAPTWSTSKQGWYNGLNRCFGGCRKDASGNYVGKWLAEGVQCAALAPAAMLTTDLLAGEALSAGDPVGLVASKWAKAKWTERQDVLIDSGAISYHAECTGDNEGEFMLVYHDTGTSYAVLYRVEFDGTLTSVATGTPAAHYPLAICKIGTGKYVMACRDLSTSTTIRFTVLTVSGGSISEGSAQTKTNLISSGVAAAAIREGFAVDEFACAYFTSTANTIHAVAGTVATSTITLGASVAIATTAASPLVRGAMSRFRIDGSTWFGITYSTTTSGVVSAFLFNQTGTTVRLSTGAGINIALITFSGVIGNLGAIAGSNDNDMRMFAVVGNPASPASQAFITVQIAPEASAGTPRDPGVNAKYEAISVYSAFMIARGVLIDGERVFTLTFSTGLSEVIATVSGASGGGVARVIRKTFPLLAAHSTSQQNGTLVAWSGRVIFVYLDSANNLYVMVIDIPDAIGVAVAAASAGDAAVVAVGGLLNMSGFGNGRAFGVDYDLGSFKAGLIPEVVRSVGQKIKVR